MITIIIIIIIITTTTTTKIFREGSTKLTRGFFNSIMKIL